MILTDEPVEPLGGFGRGIGGGYRHCQSRRGRSLASDHGQIFCAVAETEAEDRMGVGAGTVLGTAGTFLWKNCSIVRDLRDSSYFFLSSMQTWVPRWVLWRLTL
jgi:hypothetical protein